MARRLLPQAVTCEELIAACANEKYKALIFTAPSRRLADAQSDPRTYSPAELAAVSAFHEAGGMVILAGWSDNYENYDVIQGNPDIKHMDAERAAGGAGFQPAHQRRRHV